MAVAVGPTMQTRELTAGLTATLVVAAAMHVARRAELTSIHFPRAIGSAIVAHRTPTRDVVGWAAFVGNGVLIARAYRALLPAQTRAPLRGAVLGLAHGLVAALGVWLIGPLHPRRADAGLRPGGRVLPSELALLSAVHVLYGAVLGALSAPSCSRRALRTSRRRSSQVLR